jgi:hypothetical protein
VSSNLVELAAELGQDAENMKVARGNALLADIFDALACHEIYARGAAAFGRDIDFRRVAMDGFPHRAVHAELEIFAFRGAYMPGKACQTIRFRVGQWADQDGIDDAIDGGVGAYAEAEGGEHRRGKSGTLAELA